MPFSQPFQFKILFWFLFLSELKSSLAYQFTENETITFKEITFFSKKICSYQGMPIVNYKDQTIKCICREGYKSLIDSNKKLLGIPIQCSYPLKKRSITFFLALLLPLGLDFFYLGHTITGTCILICGILLIGGIFFIIIYTSQFKTSFMERNNKNDNNMFQDEKLEKKNQLVNKMKSVNWILFTVLIIYWVTDIIGELCGLIKDVNNFNTINDMSF